jgi:hypothetical protein
MPQRSVFARLMLLSSLAMEVVGCAGRAAGDAGRDPKVRDDAKRLAAAAAQVTNTLRQRTEAGEALTPEFVQLVCDWSVRLCRLEAAAAVDHASYVAAAREHLDRMQELHRLVHPREVYDPDNPASRVPQVIAEFHVREAELWLARAEAK